MNKNKLVIINRVTRALFLAALSLFLFAAIPSAYAGHAQYSGVIVFGDSLSDPGNAWALTGQETVAPYEPVPTFPYAIGGHHFSNGKIYIERLARSIHLNSSAKAAFDPELAKATNYALGGGRARMGGPRPEVELSAQVGAFLSDVGGIAPSDALYVIWIGGNDVRDALVASSLPESLGILGAALASEAANIGALAAAGATHFLVLNSPNLGVVPAVVGLGPQAVAGATLLSAGYNFGLAGTPIVGLDTVLDGVELIFPGIEITRFDAFSFLNVVVEDGEAYGFSNTTTPCLTFFVAEDAVCKKPKAWMFGDGIHPTTATHALIAELLEDVLNAP
jgi:phospholipase/lecithinase/hemolysin